VARRTKLKERKKMATIVKRGKTYAVVYKIDGKQRWESFKDEKSASERKTEIEYTQMKGTFVAPSELIVEKFLEQYVDIYGITKWSHSTYYNNLLLIRNYILPYIGNWKLKEITAKKMDRYFTKLKTSPSVSQIGQGDKKFISSRTIYEINRLLSNAFDRAVEWGEIGKNPITRNACPERENKPREIWDPETAKEALAMCIDINLLACMHLSISCSMRIGEITGLRWSFVSFGDVENNFENAVLQVDSQLQRISTEAFDSLQNKKDNIKLAFPKYNSNNRTQLVLKTLKTKSSNRTVWIPNTAAAILWQLKKEQDVLKDVLESEYQDYDLVIAQPNGRPIEPGTMSSLFAQFVHYSNLPPVEFHSLRHLSTTVKLIINKGDIKAVQGDTGHSRASMITDTYAHILDSNRKDAAKRFENEFYGNRGRVTETQTTESLLAQCLQNTEAIQILKTIFSVPDHNLLVSD
jgi:integrase